MKGANNKIVFERKNFFMEISSNHKISNIDKDCKIIKPDKIGEKNIFTRKISIPDLFI